MPEPIEVVISGLMNGNLPDHTVRYWVYPDGNCGTSSGEMSGSGAVEVTAAEYDAAMAAMEARNEAIRQQVRADLAAMAQAREARRIAAVADEMERRQALQHPDERFAGWQDNSVTPVPSAPVDGGGVTVNDTAILNLLLAKMGLTRDALAAEIEGNAP